MILSIRENYRRRKDPCEPLRWKYSKESGHVLKRIGCKRSAIYRKLKVKLLQSSKAQNDQNVI